MGFGLTISKMIVQKLLGDISVESAYDSGSTFTFNIPVDIPKENLMSMLNIKFKKVL